MNPDPQPPHCVSQSDEDKQDMSVMAEMTIGNCILRVEKYNVLTLDKYIVP